MATYSQKYSNKAILNFIVSCAKEVPLWCSDPFSLGVRSSAVDGQTKVKFSGIFAVQHGQQKCAAKQETRASARHDD